MAYSLRRHAHSIHEFSSPGDAKGFYGPFTSTATDTLQRITNDMQHRKQSFNGVLTSTPTRTTSTHSSPCSPKLISVNGLLTLTPRHDEFKEVRTYLHTRVSMGYSLQCPRARDAAEVDSLR